MLESLQVRPGTPAELERRDPGDALGIADKKAGKTQRDELAEEMIALQALLWAEKRRSVLLVLQGMDGAGKDSTVRRVFKGVNPQGCRVTAFGRPHAGELAHDYLWRVHVAGPQRGEIGIFNRSHYEDIIVPRVRTRDPLAVWQPRYRHIREFERVLTDEGTTIIKVFLNISKTEQRARLQKRIDNADKQWKFDPGDLDDRERWDEYRAAYEDVLTETSTEWAPWYIVPGDHKWVRDVAISSLLVDTLRRLDPKPPAGSLHLDGIIVD
jgi:PPK2 family polyphosphate:nucleotide phosphotransferase